MQQPVSHSQKHLVSRESRPQSRTTTISQMDKEQKKMMCTKVSGPQRKETLAWISLEFVNHVGATQ